MNRQVNLIYVGEAKEAYLKLNKIVGEERTSGIRDSENQRLLKSLKKKEELLKLNPQYGDHIPRKYIKKETIKKYGTDSLWRVELSGYWRAIYTLAKGEIEILALILDVVDHNKYNKLFVHYRKK